MGREVIEKQLWEDPERAKKWRTLKGRWCTAEVEEAVAAKAFEALAQRVIECRGDSSGGGGSEREVLGFGFRVSSTVDGRLRSK